MNQKKIIFALIFKFVERVIVKGLGLIIGIILARLLEPDDFGLVAIITVFMNLAQTFVQSGFSTALVQNSTTEDDDYSTVFYISTMIAVVLVVVLYFSAPYIAIWYDKSILVWPLRVMSLSLLLGAFNSVQNARMQREMQFRTMMYCNLIATVISGIVGIVVACLGAGLWALVIYNLANIILVSICMYVAGNWRPKAVFNLKRAALFWGYGWKLLVSGLLCSIYSDIRALVVGIKYSTLDLAYYNKGQQFPELISLTLDNAVQSVMLPVMSSKQDDTKQLSEVLLKSLSLSMFVISPLMLGLAAVAKTFIPLLLTEKWLPSVPLMIVFCLSSLTVPVMMTNLSAIKAMGRSDVYMKTEIIRRLAMLVVLLITIFCFDSVMVIAIGYLISSVIDITIIVVTMKQITEIRVAKQIGAVWKPLLAGFIMSLIVYAMNLLPLAYIWRLTLQVLVGALVYLGLSAALRMEAFYYLIHIIKKS